MVFVFGPVCMIDYICRFVYVELALHPWDEADLIVILVSDKTDFKPTRSKETKKGIT